jgi:hypothetical protein
VKEESELRGRVRVRMGSRMGNAEWRLGLKLERGFVGQRGRREVRGGVRVRILLLSSTSSQFSNPIIIITSPL